MHKILVFGSSGILGKIIVNQICQRFGKESLIISDYSVERAEKFANLLQLTQPPRIINVNDINSLVTNLDDVTGAIIPTQQNLPLIQQECIKRGIVTVDFTAFKPFVEKVQKLNTLAQENSVPTLVMAGYFPGISGVAVNQVIKYFHQPETISVSLLQNTNASTGKSGFIDMLKIINTEIVTKQGKIKGFTSAQNFFHANYQKILRQYQIKSDEAEIISDLYDLEIKYFTGWENRNFNNLVQLINQLGITNFLINNSIGTKLAHLLHPPKEYQELNQEKTSITIKGLGMKDGKHDEKNIYINAKSDYLATAIAAVTMLQLVLENKTHYHGGVFMPHQLFNLDILAANFPPAEIQIAV